MTVLVQGVAVTLEVLLRQDTHKVVISHTITKDIQHRAAVVLADTLQDTEGQTVNLAFV